MDQVAECLLSKLEALSLIPSTTKNQSQQQQFNLTGELQKLAILISFFFELERELRAFTLSHSTSPIF
jgi:hypothetical protein